MEAKQQEQRELRQASSAAGGTDLSVLAALAGAPQQSRPLVELQPKTGMNFFDFSQALKWLQGSGYLTVVGETGHEIVQPTKAGPGRGATDALIPWTRLSTTPSP
jgi:hypothetical protein